MALLTYWGSEAAVHEHMKKALKHGATEQELLEAIETTVIPGGGPTLIPG